MKYRPEHVLALTTIPLNQGVGHFQSGSLTGAVSSQRVTEDREGHLMPVGNRQLSVWIEGGLTARPTSRADTKVGPSDPVTHRGMLIA